jgi:hypothetical protein
MLGNYDEEMSFELERHCVRAIPDRADIPVTKEILVEGKEYQCWSVFLYLTL